MKKLWVKFLVASVLCTSLATPMFATSITSIASDTPQLDLQLEDKEQVVVEVTEKKTYDDYFYVTVSGTTGNDVGTVALSFELQDKEGNSYGTLTTGKDNVEYEYLNILKFNVPKYKKGSSFKLILKDAPVSVTSITLGDKALKVGDSVDLEVTEVTGDTGSKVLYGSKEHNPRIDVLAERINSVGIGVMLNGAFKEGVTLGVKDITNNTQTTIDTLDSYYPYIREGNTEKLQLSVLSDGFKFKGVEDNSKVITLEKGKENLITIEVERVEELINSKQDYAISELALNLNTTSNYELSTYWSDIALELTSGDSVFTVTDLKIGKNTMKLPAKTYKVAVVDSSYGTVTGVKDVNLTKEGATLNLDIEPTHKVLISKSVDGVSKAYKFKVINVPEIADKVFSGTEPISFAVMPGESYMLQDVDTNAVLNVVINEKNPVTKVVLGEGIITGVASVPETGDNGTLIVLGLIISLILVLAVLGVIVYKKKGMKLNAKQGSKVLSLVLALLVVGSGLPVTNVYASGANIESNGGQTNGTDTIARVNTGELKKGVVRVYPAKLTDIGFSPSEGNYDANGTKEILSTEQKYWLQKYSVFFAPDTTTLYKWINGSYIVSRPVTQAIAEHKTWSASKSDGTYHYITSQGSQLLYHDYFDRNHVDNYMSYNAKQNLVVNVADHGYGNTNLFVNIMEKAIKNKNIREDSYGEVLQKEFSAILADPQQKEKLWSDYKEIAMKKYVYTAEDFVDLDKAFAEGKLGFFVESIIGWDTNANYGGNSNLFMSLRTYLQILNGIRPEYFSLSDVKYEAETAQKSSIKGCYGRDDCGGNNALCDYFHHLRYSHFNINKAYTVTLRPSTKPLQQSGSNPFGGWGYLHMSGKGVPVESQPGIYVIFKDATVRKEDGSIVEVATMMRSADDKVELSGYGEGNTGNNSLMALAKTETISAKGLPLASRMATFASSETGKQEKAEFNFTEDSEVRVFLDSEYQKNIVYDVNTPVGLGEYPVGTSLGYSNSPLGLGTLTSNEISATITKPEPGSNELVIGYGDPNTNWTIDNLNMYIRGECTNGVKFVYEGDKYNAEGTALLKKKGDLSDVVVVVTNAELVMVENEIATEKSSVDEWKLSNYWETLVEKGEEAYSTSDIGTPTKDDPSSDAGPGYLEPSGYTLFEKELKDKDDLPSYFHSKPIWAEGVNGTGYITRGKTSEELQVQGNLLAVKETGTIDDVKTAKWVNGVADLSSLGISSTDKGAESAFGTVTKNYTFKYIIKNPETYTNYYAYHYHDVGDNGDWVDGDWVSDPYDICECELRTQTLSDTSTGTITPASYLKSVMFERYKPVDTVAPTVPYKETKENGSVYITAQSPLSLFVNPEVLMSYADKNGRESVTFVAGDKLREVKPVSFHAIKYFATVKPTVVGTAVASNSEAKALANTLGAGAKSVIYKGAGVNISFDIDGKTASEDGYVETKSYILDIGNTGIKNVWNPSTTYNSQKINEQFLNKFSKIDSTGTRYATSKVVEQLKIDANLYGKNISNLQLKEIENNVTEYKLVVRGGKLISVNGRADYKTSLNAELVKALEEMTLTANTGVLSVFDSKKGKKPDSTFVRLGNSVRGTTDLATSSGWYNEDTTVLVVREYTSKFELPTSMFVDKVPMSIPNLQAPVNKLDFFKVGKTGHTVYVNSLLSTNATLNPYDANAGNVEAVTMTHDSSSTSSPFGAKTIDYVVPNVSILDSTH